jgi:hypothetical protein
MAVERREFMFKLNGAMTRMINRKLSGCFESWQAAFAPRDDPMSKALLYFLNRELARGWVGWHSLWFERKEYLRLLRKGVSFMLNRELARGLSVWRQAVAPQDDPMSKAMRYFFNRELARGWVGWHSSWAEQKAKLESMRRSLGHFINRELSRGWGVWVEMAVERAAFMFKLNGAFTRMRNFPMPNWSITTHRHLTGH